MLEDDREAGELCPNCGCRCEAEECICDVTECMFCDGGFECSQPWREDGSI